MLVLTARSAAALDAQVARLRNHLESHPDLFLGDVAFNLATTRSPMDHRLAVATSSRQAALVALAAVAQGGMPPGVFRGSTATSRGKHAFLYGGQGPAVCGMGRELYGAWPVFREAFDWCVALFDAQLDRPLLQVMWSEPASAEAALLDQPAFRLPALFTLEHALTALWHSWGVDPELVGGRDIGEVAAACVAGVLSLKDAVDLAVARGRLLQTLPADAATESIPEEPPGAPPTLQPSDRFAQVAQSIAYQRPTIPLVSSLSGELLGDEVTTPAHWVHQVGSAGIPAGSPAPICDVAGTAEGVKALHQAGAALVIEIGPGATRLAHMPVGPTDAPTVLPAPRAGREETLDMLSALGGYWASGNRSPGRASSPRAA